jgi:hypothetical protein
MVVPEYKMILTYDILASRQSEYSQFIIGTFIPHVQALHLYVLGVYHTVYGQYPVRQAEFGSDDWDTMVQAVNHSRFLELEGILKTYTYNYKRKIVRYRPGFQL